jgi:hypothetical protein
MLIWQKQNLFIFASQKVHFNFDTFLVLNALSLFFVLLKQIAHMFVNSRFYSVSKIPIIIIINFMRTISSLINPVLVKLHKTQILLAH